MRCTDPFKTLSDYFVSKDVCTNKTDHFWSVIFKPHVVFQSILADCAAVNFHWSQISVVQLPSIFMGQLGILKL